jgi:hypothetical protein
VEIEGSQSSTLIIRAWRGDAGEFRARLSQVGTDGSDVRVGVADRPETVVDLMWTWLAELMGKPPESGSSEMPDST